MSIKSVMLSIHFISSCPLLLLPSIFASIRVFPNESLLPIRCPKYWSFSFSISLSNEYSGLISFRIGWFDLLAVQGTLKSFLQYHSSKASILRHSAFLLVQLPHLYMAMGETIALTRQNFVNKVMFLLFNLMSRFVIAFLPRSKHLLISWLQSPSAVILVLSVSCSVVSNSLQPHGLWPARFFCPWDSPDKNTGVDCHSLIQRIFLIQGSNSGLLHCRQILYCLRRRENKVCYCFQSLLLFPLFSPSICQSQISCRTARKILGLSMHTHTHTHTHTQTQKVSHSVMSNTLQPHGLWPTRLLCPWKSPVKNTGVGCHSLFQGIFLTQGSDTGLLHCRQFLYHLSHKGSPYLFMHIP